MRVKLPNSFSNHWNRYAHNNYACDWGRIQDRSKMFNQPQENVYSKVPSEPAYSRFDSDEEEAPPIEVIDISPFEN